jgi:hypothetical protein
VWNYPVLAYRTTERRVPKDLAKGKLADNPDCQARLRDDALQGFRGRAGKGVACIVDLTTEVWHLDLASPGDAGGGAPHTPDLLAATRMVLKYSLELDDDGYVTGGEWDTDDPTLARPDVLWLPKVDFATLRVEAKSSLINYDLLQKLLP